MMAAIIVGCRGVPHDWRNIPIALKMLRARLPSPPLSVFERFTISLQQRENIHWLLALLDQAWLACQAAEREAMRTGVLRQAEQEETRPATPVELDSLTDEQVEALYHSTLREIAQDSRQRS